MGKKNKNNQKNQKEKFEHNPMACESCGKGTLKEFVIEGPHKTIVWLVCDLCGHRKKPKEC